MRLLRRAIALCAATAGSLELSAINRGQLVVVPRWADPALVASLRADIAGLRPLFRPCGVSNTATARTPTPGFSATRDRRVCVISDDLAGDVGARAALARALTALATELEAAAARPRLRLEEMYYSLHGPGARLGRHMDERHEETKGEEAAWALPTRRSVSWILYLNELWDDGGAAAAGRGGALRVWCREHGGGAACGARDGDLQAGWLLTRARARRGSADPVFLDAWARSPDDGAAPRCALYRVDARGARRALSAPFGAAEVHAAARGEPMTPRVFHRALAAQLPPSARGRFESLEAVDAPAQRRLDISPQGGTLVLFDSVAVPHEVLPTERGERAAVAGWFHEPQQAPPEWFG